MNPKTKTALIVCSAISAVLMLFGPLLIGGAVISTVAGGMTISEGSGTAAMSDDDCDLDGSTSDKKNKNPTTAELSASTGGTGAHTVEAFGKANGEAAYKTAKKYNVPTEVVLGQAAWESGWGDSVLAAQHNNFFGIKKYDGCSNSVMIPNSDGNVEWCAFDSKDVAFAEYGKFIRNNSRYDNSMEESVKRDPLKYLLTILEDGYCPEVKAYYEGCGGIVLGFTEWLNKEHPDWAAAKIKYDKWEGRTIDADAAKKNDADKADKKDDKDTDKTDGKTVTAACTAKKDKKSSKGGDAKYGSAGGAPDDTKDYGWMCKAIGVCKDGDGFDPSNTRLAYPKNVSRYQCVWYAWNRLGMIHGVEGWSTVLGHGGQIAGNLKGLEGWTVDSFPHPGDGVSQLGGALGGTASIGHVAVVEDVKKDGDKWKIRISEGNWDDGGAGNWTAYHTRWLTQDQFAGQGDVFFRNDAWKK